jgi:hypothetical protein
VVGLAIMCFSVTGEKTSQVMLDVE